MVELPISSASPSQGAAPADARERPGRRSRQRRVEEAVDRAFQRRSRAPSRAAARPTRARAGGPFDLGKALPRPQRLRTDWRAFANPPRRELEVFRAGPHSVLFRVVVWMMAGARYAAGVLADILLRRDTIERRAQRLRETLEKAGPAAIKMGQQLSMRVDLLPYAFTHELEKMLDSVPAFPNQQAIEIIESSTGRRIPDMFAVFDPEPIASASIASVYQALLPTGERVAIKVRRPGIGKALAADLEALRWLLKFLELFLLPPGFMELAYMGLRTMLLEELDFVREARYTDLFRKRARKGSFGDFSAPRVYFEYSNREILVTEFVTGIFLTEVLAAVESKDQEALAKLASQNIDPTQVAKQLIRVAQYGTFEALLFHADIHPSNVLVLPNNRLVLIDFGSCGAFTEPERAIWRRTLHAQGRDDVSGMVQGALALLEPLPPIDVDKLTKEMESVFWQDLFAMKSKHSEWWERTTANAWLDLAKVARRHRVPMNLNTVRMIRVLLLADTVALRLDRDINHYKEYHRYLRDAGKRAKRRLRRRLRQGLRNQDFVELEQVTEAGSALFYRIRRFLDAGLFNYAKLQSKAAYGLSVVLKTTFLMAVVTAGAGLVLSIVRARLGQPVAGLSELAGEVMASPWYLVFAGAVVYVTARRLLYRLKDRDVND
jgi:ubiquinone biosynthesis protein